MGKEQRKITTETQRHGENTERKKSIERKAWFTVKVTLPVRNLATDKHGFSQNPSVFIRGNPWLIFSEKMLP